VIVDCTDLTFMDSSGMHVLEDARDALETQGREIHVVNVGRKPRRVFEVLGFTDMLRDNPASG
jgi:anti-anti-sigma factor